MQKVTVTPHMGATLRGPARIKLTRNQWARRTAVLGPVPERMKAVDIDSDQVLHFKRGESFEIEVATGRLNKAVFDFEDEKAQPAFDAPGDDTAPAA